MPISQPESMIRQTFLLLPLLAALSGPALAQSPAPAPPPRTTSADTDALRASLQQQLQACWSVPPAFAESDISVTITLHVLGNGVSWQPPEIEVSEKSAAKVGGLIASVERAVARCDPFTGFEDIGAEADEKFSVAVIFAGH